MTDLSRFLHFLYKGPHIVILEEMGAGTAEVMEQIEVKVSCSRPFQGRLKLSDGVFSRLAVDPCGVLRGKGVGIPGIPFHQCLPDGFLASLIGPGGVKISKARFQELVHQHFHLFHIDDIVLFWQTHQTESEFFRFFQNFLHMIHPLPSSPCLRDHLFFLHYFTRNKNLPQHQEEKTI